MKQQAIRRCRRNRRRLNKSHIQSRIQRKYLSSSVSYEYIYTSTVNSLSHCAWLLLYCSTSTNVCQVFLAFTRALSLSLFQIRNQIYILVNSNEFLCCMLLQLNSIFLFVCRVPRLALVCNQCAYINVYKMCYYYYILLAYHWVATPKSVSIISYMLGSRYVVLIHINKYQYQYICIMKIGNYVCNNYYISIHLFIYIYVKKRCNEHFIANP